MPSTRIVAVVLLVALAGCSGLTGDTATTTDEPTTVTTNAPTSSPTTELSTSPTAEGPTVEGTEPHTAVGTSHIDTHLRVSTSPGVDNVTVTLGTGANAETYAVNGSIDLTREIHDRGHEVRAVVERGNERVFNRTVYGYQYWEVAVEENHTRVSQTVV